MSHSILCARSSSRRCRCSCAGLLHGYASKRAGFGAGPDDAQLTLASSDPPGPRGRLRAGSGTASYLRGWVRTHRRLVATITEVATDGVWRGITALPGLDPGHVVNSAHALCGLLAAMAVQLDDAVTDADGSATGVSTVGHEPGHDDSSLADLGEIAAATTDAVVDRIFELIGAAQPDEVATVVRIAALATCPDVDWHPEVQQLARAANGDGVTRGLGRLAGYSQAVDPVPA